MNAPPGSTPPGGFRELLRQDHPAAAALALPADAWTRFERLADASPLYARLLRQHPDYCLWLELPQNRDANFRYQALLDEWQVFSLAVGEAVAGDETHLSMLRRWRRKMTLRIAYRDINGLAHPSTTVDELTRLGEFCLRECYALACKQWTHRYGEPWDEELDHPARFCVLGLGKLGGQELNFSSDIDLLYFYEGEGHCRKDGAPGVFSNIEFFTKVAETITSMLQTQTADGFLFRVDVRLRPEGAYGPLVRSLAGLEHYYAAAGQTWERMALIKARPVAGDLALGAELFESLHAFRYPRHPPPSLLAEVAAMKTRTEQEVVGAQTLNRDVKSGPGGIREIEFIAQAFQLLHAGRYPFLQTHATTAALDQLVRYGLMQAEEARFLVEAYWFLRRIEHAIQMREEHQSHSLPADVDEEASIARTLGFPSIGEFQLQLEAVRARVRRIYDGLFRGEAGDRAFQDWWTFFTSSHTPPAIAGQLQRWLGPSAAAADELRLFVCGDRGQQVNRELVVRFQHLAHAFDEVMPRLAQPMPTLRRIAHFAERYGTRQQFFNGCAANPQFFRVLALLFDRSTFIYELLGAHPEIAEEVLRPEVLRKRKDAATLAEELAAGPTGEGSADWLWLYVKAEQVRYAIGELLGFLDIEGVESCLSLLADAVMTQVLGRLDPRHGLLLVALGKYGGAELSFGSDLDLLLLAREADAAAAEPVVRELQRLMRHGGPLGAIFAIDLRLRPHGEAGPPVTTPAVLRAYHAAGSAQAWERQLLTRARVVTGPPELAAEFTALTDELLYRSALAEPEAAAMWAMRGRIERERDAVSPPERAFKTGPGGLVDFEFLVQLLQLRHGHARRELRQPGTRQGLRTLTAVNLVPAETAERLLDNYNFLKRIEILIRGDVNKAVSVLAATPEERTPLSFWMGFPEETAFWAEHCHRLAETRRMVLPLLPSGITFAQEP
ncbi:MAG: bifunctional [glutamate--ammonia ligase]-adenylyl-L-tyrosine phosphorylase/[glutamate--ammonia-ligase] adenylyltransferase [Opitutaceae bacterium]